MVAVPLRRNDPKEESSRQFLSVQIAIAKYRILSALQPHLLLPACPDRRMPSPGVSPPPLKRLRTRISGSPQPPHTHPLSPPPPSSPPSISTHDVSTADSLHIYSWNINGIGPFLPPSSTPPITNFLKPASAAEPAPPPPPPPPPPPSRPSLRPNLKRWEWPRILCLQEVKIAPADAKTQASVRRVVKHALRLWRRR